MTMDLDRLGTFDVVLYSGVLYHMRDPLRALERVAQVTAGSAFIESHVVVLKGHEQLPAAVFYETIELDGDITNWWGPTIPGAQALCRAAGFRNVQLLHTVESQEGGTNLVDDPFRKDQPRRWGVRRRLPPLGGDVLNGRAVLRADK